MGAADVLSAVDRASGTQTNWGECHDHGPEPQFRADRGLGARVRPRPRRPLQHRCGVPGRWTLAAGGVLTLGIGLLKVSQQSGSGLFEWKGLVQRVLLVAFMAWIFAVAFRLRRQ